MLARVLDPANAAPLSGLLARLVAGARSHDLVNGPLLGGFEARTLGVTGVLDQHDAAGLLRRGLLACFAVVATAFHLLDGLNRVDVPPRVLAGGVSFAPIVDHLNLGALTGLVDSAPVPHRLNIGVLTRILSPAPLEDNADGGVLTGVLALTALLVLADRAREAVARFPPVAAPRAVAAGLFARLTVGSVPIDADDTSSGTLNGGPGDGGRGGGGRGARLGGRQGWWNNTQLF